MGKLVGDSGATVREHMQQVGQVDEGPGAPDVLLYLWEWFVDLSSARQSGMGPAPLTYEGIAAWSRLTGTTVYPWEIKALKDLDMMWLRVNAKHG